MHQKKQLGETSPKSIIQATTFDANTEANVKQFQALVGLDADGIFGARSRNYMAAAIGISPMGWVRVLSQTESLINYNYTPDGARADGVEKSCQLDHSWVTTTTSQTLKEIANKFFQQTNYRLQINDCSLIDGHHTPEHSKHDDRKTIDSAIATTKILLCRLKSRNFSCKFVKIIQMSKKFVTILNMACR
ncbi:peptidoglycan-binding protein [Paenibacillus amylolyticus]|uniref:peptidoglycan-binding protein n=1 Tax=Paenibacillus amylolyticus TaxID=1451 RepID=UPI001374B862|nr:peptidoglycan-binding protein [Paenibacillus amylolyticus]